MTGPPVLCPAAMDQLTPHAAPFLARLVVAVVAGALGCGSIRDAVPADGGASATVSSGGASSSGGGSSGGNASSSSGASSSGASSSGGSSSGGSSSGSGSSSGDPDAGATGGTRIVLFGGWNGTQSFDDTWTWDGAAWTKVDIVGGPPPSARSSHAMAALAGKVYLFGGADANGARLGDTWQLDGATWTKLSVSGPSPRSGHVMATLGGSVVLFGGESPPAKSSETWLWDGVAWTKKADVGPSARHAAAASVLDGKLVLVGGSDVTGKELNDTWVWDGSAWANTNAVGPPITSHAAMATANRHAFHFGGASLADETWVWDGSGWSQLLSTDMPTRRYGAAMAALGAVPVLFGGNDGARESDTWRVLGAGWVRVQAIGPAGRQNHAMVSLP